MDFSGTPKSTPKKCGCHGMVLNSFGHKKTRKACFDGLFGFL